MNKKVLLVLIYVVSLVLIFGLTSLAQKTEKDALDLVIERGKLLVSTELGNDPWSFEDPKTGETTGFAIELIRMYAEEIGVEPEFKFFEWAGIIPSLTTGKVDIIVAPLSRTMARSLKILFTDAYIIEPTIGFALKGKFKDISEINKKGVVIVCTAGSNHEPWAIEHCPEATVNPLPTLADEVAAVISGRGDVSLCSYITAAKIIQTNPNLEIIPGGYALMDSFAFAVRYDSFKLCKTIDMFMGMIKLDGRYAQLYKKFLGIEWKPNSSSTSL